MKRKDFLNLSAKAALFLGLAPTVACNNSQNKTSEQIAKDQIDALLGRTGAGSAFGMTAPKIDKVKVALIGAGNRGAVLIQMFDWLIQNAHAEIVAISDLKKEKVDALQAHLTKTQSHGADLYYGGTDEWKKTGLKFIG